MILQFDLNLIHFTRFFFLVTIYVYIYTYICTCIHTHIYIHTHIHLSQLSIDEMKSPGQARAVMSES